MSKKINIKSISKKLSDKFYKFLIPESKRNFESFTNDQLKALSDRRTISKLLFHRTYFELEDNENLGFYKMADGKIGTIFKVNPPPYLSKSVESVIVNVLGLIVRDDTIVHINAYAGSNIDDVLKDFTKEHPSNNINIKNPDLIKEYVSNKVEYLDKWRNSSIASKDADLRVRNFTHTISILFPPNTEEWEIIEQSSQIYGVLKDIGARKMEASEFVPLVREILDPEADKYNLSNDTMTKLNKQMTKGAQIKLSPTNGTLTFGKNESWKAKVLTTDKFPHEVSLYEYQNAFFDALGNDYQVHLPCPFLVSLVIKYTNIEKRRKSIKSKAKWNIGQLSGLGMVLEKKMPSLKTRRLESETVISLLEEMGEVPLDAQLSITVWERDENKLNQHIGALKKSFEQINGRWIWKEETYSQIAYQILMMSLNLQYSEPIHQTISKMDITFKSNNSQIAPLIGDFKGYGKPIHFYLGPTGQTIPIDFFNSKTNYNVVVIGPMGSGKSFLANDLLINGLAANWDIRMLDFGRSYQKISENVGGQFIEFPKDNNMCLNFFTNAVTKKVKGKEVIHEDEFDTLVPIVGLMMGVKLKNIYKDAKDSSSERLKLTIISRFVTKAIQRAFEVEGKNAGMQEVVQSLEEFRQKEIQKIKDRGDSDTGIISIINEMIIALENYSIKNAPYYKYFNGVNNINLDSSFIITELDDIADSPIMPVVAMSVLQRMAQEAFIKFLENKNKKRIVGVDEAWRVLDSDLFSSFFEDFARRIRKYGGITLIITQTISDFFKNSSSEAIFETAAWKIFLPQETESIDKAKDNKTISMTNFEVDLLKSIKSKKPHYNEFIVKHEGFLFKCLLKVTPDDYWFFTSDSNDRSKIDNIIKEKKFSLNEAIYYLGRKSEGIREEEIIYKMTEKKNRDSKLVNWDKFLKDAIAENRITMTSQKIFKIDYEDKNNKKLYAEEFFMKIKERNYLHSRMYFLEAAKKRDLHFDIAKIFFNKILLLLQKEKDNKKYFIVNLDMFELENQKFLDYILSSLKDLGESRERIIFEIKLDYQIKENFEKLVDFNSSLKKLKIRLAFDDATLDQIDIQSILKIYPKYVKISIKKIEDLNEKEKNYLQSIFFLFKDKFNITSLLTKIEDEEDIEFAKEFGANHLQGFYLEKPKEV